MDSDKDRRDEEQEPKGPVVVDRRGEESEEPEAPLSEDEQQLAELGAAPSSPISDANKLGLLVIFEDEEVTTMFAALLADMKANTFKKLSAYQSAEEVADHLNGMADEFNKRDPKQREWFLKRAAFALHQLGWYIKFRNAEAAAEAEAEPTTPRA